MSKEKDFINEDKKRFKLLMEYDFYIGEEEEVEPEGDLLTEPEDEMAPEGGEELPVDGEEAPEGGEEPLGDEMPDGEIDGDVEFGGPEGEDEGLPEPEAMEEPLPEPEPMEDEVELDVTQLVQGTEAAKMSADHANQQIGNLLNKFDELSNSLNKMDSITSKIDSMEHEMEKRNPTPEEQLEMRSLDSFPYSLKLTDYWSEKEGNYDAMKNDKGGNPEEYVLTQDEVDQDYNNIHIKDSFGETEQDEQIKY